LSEHGTCSGLDQKTYLQTAMDIEMANPTPRAITDNIGSSVALSDLQKAFNATGCGSGSCWTGFNCAVRPPPHRSDREPPARIAASALH